MLQQYGKCYSQCIKDPQECLEFFDSIAREDHWVLITGTLSRVSTRWE